MSRTETTLETSVSGDHLTLLIAREDFIKPKKVTNEEVYVQTLKRNKIL